MSKICNIFYTITDEAPALATYSLLPIIRAFVSFFDIKIKSIDISLSNRILSKFSECIKHYEYKVNNLDRLINIISSPKANLIKLPNISASLPQLKSAIIELQFNGYKIPDYIDKPQCSFQKLNKAKYDQIRGSVVNSILRNGNSERFIPKILKNYVRKYPHYIGKWESSSLSHVSHMTKDDFYNTEKSILINDDKIISIILVDSKGKKSILKENIEIYKNEIIDAAKMSKISLVNFIKDQIVDAKNKKVIFSLHLKSTMMKVSDPIIFGLVVYEFYKKIFVKYKKQLESLNINVENGMDEFFYKMKNLSIKEIKEIKEDINNLYNEQPMLAMVDCKKGITNLHSPNNIIIDSSMSNMIRNSGKMLGRDGLLHDTKAVIPDGCYASIYQKVIQNCKKYGAFNPSTIGSLINIGLMSNQAEEYGSHDKTFQIKTNGKVQIIDERGNILIEHYVEKGDIWRMCRVQDESIKDWVKLAINKVSILNKKAIFWLDSNRSHDKLVIQKVKSYLKKYNVSQLSKFDIMNPIDAMKCSLKLIRSGKDIISITGNVLRDYLTDLFPIIEVGTSARTVSIISLASGGYVFETGSGGSAPKHVEQFNHENHLRWDSLGELLALETSIKYSAIQYSNNKLNILSKSLNQAIAKLLDNNKIPSYKVKEIDTRGSHFYLTLFWAEMLSNQKDDIFLRNKFANLYHLLKYNEEKILLELSEVQGNPINIGGYYYPDPILVEKAMRPSNTFNYIIKSLKNI